MKQGTLVVVWRDREALLTRTRSEVKNMNGTLFVLVEGKANGCPLAKVREPIIHPSAIPAEPNFLKTCESVSPKDREALNERLAALENWGGRVAEFLDYFDGSFEDDEGAQEAQALQEEGLKLGLVRIYPPKKDEENVAD